jgi:hypothetical protein
VAQQPQLQVVIPPSTVENKTRSQQVQKPATSLVALSIGFSLLLVLCLAGGYYLYLMSGGNSNISSTAIPFTENTPIPVATEVPSQISATPTTVVQEPSQFIIYYWETIIYDKNYDLAWSLLTDNFKQTNNPKGFIDWKSTMEKLVQWERPTSMNMRSISASMVVVHVDKIHFFSVSSPDTGYDLLDINYCLSRDESRNTWVIELFAVCNG